MRRVLPIFAGFLLASFAACTVSEEPAASDRSDDTRAGGLDGGARDATVADASNADTAPADAATVPWPSGELAMDSPVATPRNMGPVAAANDGEQVVFAAHSRIFRLLPDGTSVEAPPIQIPGLMSSAIAYDGTQFIVAAGVYEDMMSQSIRAIRVTRQGTILDPAGIVAVASRSNPTELVATREGDGILTGWISPDPYHHVFQSITVSRDGTVGPLVYYGSGSPPQYNIIPYLPTVAPGRTICTFSGVSNGGRYVQGISACGYPLGPINGTPSDATSPALSQEGDLLAWLRHSDNTVVADGVTLGGKGTSVAAGFDGTSYHVVWATDSSPKMLLEQRLTRGKAILDPVPLPIASGVFDGFAVTCPGGTCTVGFADKDGLAAARLASGTGGVGPRIPLAQTPRNNETAPRVVAGPNGGYLAIWKDDRSSTYPLYAVRVGADGRVLDAQAIHVADEVHAFSVSATNAHYVIAVPPSGYGSDDAPRILRIDAATGELVDPPPTPFHGSSSDVPGIACGPSECLVAWQTSIPSSDGGASESAIVGRRIDAQGATIGPSSFVIGAGFGNVSVARNDAGIYLVGWQKLAARVDGSTGNVLDPTPLSFQLTDNALAVASNGTDFLVSANTGRSAVRITATGNVLDPTGFPVQSHGAGASLAALSGNSYFLTWHESRNGQCGIYGAVLGADGSVTPPTGAPYVTDACPADPGVPWRPAYPAVTSHRDGKAFLGFVRHDGSDRIRAIRITPER